MNEQMNISSILPASWLEVMDFRDLPLKSLLLTMTIILRQLKNANIYKLTDEV